jgi:polysaccharide export outer membrane protein
MQFTACVRLPRRVAHSLCLIFVAVLVSTPSTAQEYLVGPEDVLAVTVTNQPSLSGKFTVVADGTMTYPLLGSVQVGGMSLQAVRRELTARLADGLLKNPIVTVALDQAVSQHVFITGEVRQAGRYPLSGRTTLLETLLKAGVLPQTAKATDILVVRSSGNVETTAPTVIHVSFDALQRGDASQNVTLEPGDIVFVPKGESSIPVYVMGLVKSPGVFQVPPGTTVLQALAQAGGVTDRGSTHKITIIRKNGERNVESRAALHDVVQSGDTIVIGRRLF